MKKFKFCKEKIKTLSIGVFISSVIFSSSVFATETKFEANFSEDYKKWIESSSTSESIMPKTFNANVPDSILNEYKIEENRNPSLRNAFLVKAFNLEPVSELSESARYNLAEQIPMRVKHQGSTSECWAFTLYSCMESNIAIKNNITNISEIPDFSERHMDYSTAKTFTDGINNNGYNREVGKGGIPIMGLSYLNNGSGAVLEEYMPFEDNENQIELSNLDKPVDTTITGYKTLSGIYKEYDENGQIKYKDAAGEYYTNEEVVALRKIIKENIIENGAISAMTAGNHRQYYNNPTDLAKSTAYFCNDANIIRDHAITIVGWDDNYSKEKFNAECRPTTDGAYIVLNSYGENAFDNGYLYISYEDVLIETDLYVITGTEKVDYDKIYQNDFFGGMYAVGTSTKDVGYYSNVYTRDYSKNNEYLTDVGITVSDYVSLEIYVNPEGNSSVLSSLIKVGESEGVLEPGYHKINVTPTKLTGNEFSIVVKQKSENGIFYFTIETSVLNSVYSDIQSSGNSYYSVDGNIWENVNDLSVLGINMKTADVCIKAFTEFKEVEEIPEENKFESTAYLIKENSIMKIAHNTTKSDFLKNINTTFDMNIYEGEQELTGDNSIIKTGMKLKVSNGTEYTLIVRGDVNSDGKITLVDLSRMLLHYAEQKEYILNGFAFAGADLNCDDKVTLVDISQFIVLYTQL